APEPPERHEARDADPVEPHQLPEVAEDGEVRGGVGLVVPHGRLGGGEAALEHRALGHAVGAIRLAAERTRLEGAFAGARDGGRREHGGDAREEQGRTGRDPRRVAARVLKSNPAAENTGRCRTALPDARPRGSGVRRYCTLSGGSVKLDRPGRFVATRAPAAPTCPAAAP